ncbi:MAG: tRNA uridine-5-carboxymethylaminomethyl(34) synthesis GTPase MnmE [Clostridia bacterium]|nr:tRNA uridine-5-carboxymethylaminomethyl(34) synthesis GTPase MnmE [Clostridia bacterium]
MMHQEMTTVAAVSTPYGRGGIAVIRISGPDAKAISDRVFIPAGGPLDEPNRTVWGRIYYKEEQIDDGMAVYFRAPHSYTGEDTVEISCHGGIFITQKVLEAVLLAGAAPAGPGEFTKRAFLNGKLGLSQAEAIIDLIDARNMEAVRLAGAGARGALGRETEAVYTLLRDAVSSTYAFIDFPDEDLTDLQPEELLAHILEAEARLERLAASYSIGKAVNEGIRCAIVGKPNTGKSSLLNALMGEERAIVTDIAGTTRDVLEESVNIGRVMLRLADTAGIHGTDDVVEKLGVERSLRALSDAELILAVFDGAAPLDAEDEALAARLREVSCPVVCVVNKSDAGMQADVRALGVPFTAELAISARTGDGMEALRQTVESLFIDGSIDYSTDAVVANARQYAAVCAARDSVHRAADALRGGFTQDIAGMDLELAMASLAEVDGRAVTGDVVDTIFHNFCVGK